MTDNDRELPAMPMDRRLVPATESFMCTAAINDAAQCAQDLADRANAYAQALTSAGCFNYLFLQPAAAATDGTIVCALSVQCSRAVWTPARPLVIKPFTVFGYIGADDFARQATDRANQYLAQQHRDGSRQAVAVMPLTIAATAGKVAVTAWVVTYP